MANLATYGGNAILNGTPMPATLYAKLHTGAPGAAGTSNAATNTTRQSFTRSTATAMTCSNAGNITWTAVGTAETYSHVSIWDASSGGNCWWQGALGTSRAVLAVDDFQIPTGDLDLTVA